MSRKWLRRYMWSEVASGPLVRSTEHGNEESVESNGGSQIYIVEGWLLAMIRIENAIEKMAGRNERHTIWNSGRM